MIEILTAESASRERHDLIELLIDAVASGASVGFLPPLDHDEADRYWRTVEQDLQTGSRLVVVARGNGRVIGTVQLDLPQRRNGLHRAEVQRLLVHREVRRQGVGRRLMLYVEREAVRLGRTLLVLDTRLGDPSETLYHSIGYSTAGTIPDYARSADGSLHTTVFMYKQLDRVQPLE